MGLTKNAASSRLIFIPVPCTQNAYNIPTMINPTKLAPGAHRSGKYECGTPSCLIPNINSFCRPPNTMQVLHASLTHV